MTQNPRHSRKWLIPKIHVSSQSSQKTPVLADYVKFADHFSIWTRRNGNLTFTANCAKPAQFANLLSESREISAIHNNS